MSLLTNPTATVFSTYLWTSFVRHHNKPTTCTPVQVDYIAGADNATSFPSSSAATWILALNAMRPVRQTWFPNNQSAVTMSAKDYALCLTWECARYLRRLFFNKDLIYVLYRCTYILSVYSVQVPMCGRLVWIQLPYHRFVKQQTKAYCVCVRAGS